MDVEPEERSPSRTEEEDRTTTTDTSETTGAGTVTDTHTKTATHTRRSFFDQPISDKWFSRRRVTLMFAVLVALLLVSRVPSCGPAPPPDNLSVQQLEAFSRLNSFRGSVQLQALYPTNELMVKAQDWSEHMADQGQLSHGDSDAGVGPGWSSLGENVAVASSLEGVQAALEASAGHRANMAKSAFTEGGVGVVQRGGMFWVTQSFLER